jgi:hypothetical protein
MLKVVPTSASTKQTEVPDLPDESPLDEIAQARWRAVDAPHLVALVRAGAVFESGKLVERPQARAA